MNKERIQATVLIVFLVGLLLHNLYFSESILTKKKVNTDSHTIESVKKEISDIVNRREENVYTKMFNSCKSGILKGCVTGCVASGVTGGIASGVIFGIASPILVYIENYKN
jgi:hypothetical protein